jgi:hypothetical protein
MRPQTHRFLTKLRDALAPNGGPGMSQAAENLDQIITLAGGLSADLRRALLHELTARFLDEACTAQERQRLSIIIGRIGETLDLHNGAEPAPEPVSCEERLITFLRAGETDAFLACLAQLTGITIEEAASALHGGNCEALARACKAAELERATYSAIVVLSDPDRTAEQTEALLCLFDEAASESAPHVTHAAA